MEPHSDRGTREQLRWIGLLWMAGFVMDFTAAGQRFWLVWVLVIGLPVLLRPASAWAFGLLLAGTAVAAVANLPALPNHLLVGLLAALGFGVSALWVWATRNRPDARGEHVEAGATNHLLPGMANLQVAPFLADPVTVTALELRTDDRREALRKLEWAAEQPPITVPLAGAAPRGGPVARGRGVGRAARVRARRGPAIGAGRAHRPRAEHPAALVGTAPAGLPGDGLGRGPGPVPVVSRPVVSTPVVSTPC